MSAISASHSRRVQPILWVLFASRFILGHCFLQNLCQDVPRPCLFFALEGFGATELHLGLPSCPVCRTRGPITGLRCIPQKSSPDPWAFNAKELTAKYLRWLKHPQTRQSLIKTHQDQILSLAVVACLRGAKVASIALVWQSAGF